MSRVSPAPHDIAAALELFRADEGGELFDPQFEADLRVCLRMSLQTGLVLDSVGDNPRLGVEQLDNLRDDLSAALDFFHNVYEVAQLVRGLPRHPWEWQGSLEWDAFRSSYRDALDTVRAPRASLQERYGALLSAIRLQLFLWAETFGIRSGA